MIEWGKVPWSLWLYVVMTTVGMVVATVKASGSTPAAALIFFVVGIPAWNFFLLRELRWLWIATVALFALSIPFVLLTGNGTWYGNLISFIQFGLLVAPATRRFFRTGKSAAANFSPPP